MRQIFMCNFLKFIKFSKYKVIINEYNKNPELCEGD